MTTVSTTTTTETSTTTTTTTITKASPSSCTELLANNGFDAPKPANMDGHLILYPLTTESPFWSFQATDVTFSTATPPVPMNGSALRAASLCGELAPAGIQQRMSGIGAARGSMHALVHLAINYNPGGQVWNYGPFEVKTRVDLTDNTSGTVYELNFFGGPGQGLWTPSPEGSKGKIVLLEYDIRFIPDTGYNPLNLRRPHELWFDDAHFYAV
ncbi:hypothetical protein IFR05_005695 [Cadophora sp. M221]|nr:hypothetical protein IFR05_005695 [Cadophora sp. M221]